MDIIDKLQSWDIFFLVLAALLLITLWRARLGVAILAARVSIALIIWAWFRLFPSGANDYSQGAATLLAGIIAVVGTGVVALSEYQRAQGPIAQRALRLYDLNSEVNIYELFGIASEGDTDGT